jgi:DNA modification methylase
MLSVIGGEALVELRRLPNEGVQCCVTSPPYWGLRDYSSNGQLGLEATPKEYVNKLVEIFREVRRVLRRDGTLWLNLGDSYVSTAAGCFAPTPRMQQAQRTPCPNGLKPKDLVGIPWRVAFALQADGWYLRSDIIWSKPNPMPESVTDRPTKAHEYLFLLTKSPRYYYDSEAIKEQGGDGSTRWGGARMKLDTPKCFGGDDNGQNRPLRTFECNGSRNKRSVWTVATAPYPEAHFATYPPDLIKPCILAGTSARGCCAKCGAPYERIIERLGPSNPNQHERASDVLDVKGSPMYRGGTGHQGLKQAQMGSSWIHEDRGWEQTCDHIADVIPCTVLDPFAGSGTTGAVALELGRRAILIELNPKYIELIERRCEVTLGLALA